MRSKRVAPIVGNCLKLLELQKHLNKPSHLVQIAFLLNYFR